MQTAALPFAHLYDNREVAVSCVKGGLLFASLRTAELVAIGNSAKKWTRSEAVEFVATGSNAALRRRLKPEDKGITVTSKFLLSTAANALGLCGAAAIAKALLLKYPGLWAFHKPITLLEVRTHTAYCLLLYAEIEIFYSALMLPITYLFNVPYTPIFDAPYLSTSIRDWWSNRWNLPVGVSFRRIAFEPTIRILSTRRRRAVAVTSKRKHHAPGPRPLPSPPSNFQAHNRKRERTNPLHMAIATMVTFGASGVFHEAGLTLLGCPSRGTNLAFFLIHGSLVVAQMFSLTFLERHPAFKKDEKWPEIQYGGDATIDAPSVIL
ncbi:hypothetical protein BC830DRAFT_1167443 [Chytriomyces sp. MP71]|nr:hypothetical protein BC830DRAFT_1167443 [Chytriomyces sp. MP71]